MAKNKIKELKKAFEEYRRIVIIKEFPKSPVVGTQFYPEGSGYSPNHRHFPLTREEILKFYKYFSPLPFHYEILKKEGNKIISVRRCYDREVFSIGDIYSNRIAKGKEWELTGFTIQKDDVYLLFAEEGRTDCKNCTIDGAIKIR